MTKSSGFDQSARTELPRTDTFIKITNPLDRYDTGASIPDVDMNPVAQIHGENYILDGLPHVQVKMGAGVGIPTRRDDLELGRPGLEALDPPINVKRQNI